MASEPLVIPVVQLTVAEPASDPLVAVTPGASGAPVTALAIGAEGAELALVPTALLAVRVKV